MKAWLTADIKYRLYVNGRLVSRGPVDMGCDYAGGETRRWFYDFRDLTPYFTQGKNVIAAEVFHHWPIGATVSRGQPGFLFEAEVSLLREGKLTVKSDATWRAIPAAQFPNPTTYDAGKEPAGWRLAGFDDSAWPALPRGAGPLGAAGGQRDSAADGGPLPGPPHRRAAAAEDHRGRQFPRGLRPRAQRLPDAESQRWPRRRDDRPRQSSSHDGPGRGRAILRVSLHDGSCPFLHASTFKNVTSPIEILDVGANFTSQPLEYRGAFACSDGQLNRLWKVSRWAVQICLQTHHLDSPNHQEPICDPGDYVIEAMVNDYAFAQPWLTRQDVRKFAWLLKDEKYHNFHTSYSIGWLQMLIDYYDYTGDKALVEEMAPYVHELLDTYASWRGKNGLISEAPNYMFMDWVDIGGFGCHHPPAVIGQGYLTAFYYHGLEMAARVAEMTGDTARAAKYAKLRGEIAAGLQPRIVGACQGALSRRQAVPDFGQAGRTGCRPIKDIETFSPHVNLLAVLYDLAPRQRQKAIVEKVLAEKPLNTQPWFMHWVFQAIDHAGLFDRYGTPQMRRWKIVPETQSFREMWNGGDLSHGWCSTPLVQMSARVLGVRPTSPGFKTFAVRPALCDLTWASGIVPTPHGDVAVSWAVGEDKLQLDVTVPPGSEAEVVVPVERFEKATVQVDSLAAGPVVRVTAGQHNVEVTGKFLPLRQED